MRWPLFVSLVVVAISALVLTGCPKNSGNGGTAATEKNEQGHGHDHAEDDHGHSHDEGPSGGHVIVLGDEEYHIEWLHDDEEGVLTFIVLDGEMKNEVPIASENITVDLTIADEAGAKKTQQVLIAADSPIDGKTARFSHTSKADLFNITENEKVDAVLKVKINGKDYTAKIEHDAHHGHSHSHD